MGSLALASVAVPALQQTVTQASATRLQDGTLAAPNLGAMTDPPDGPRADERARIAVCKGVAALADGPAVRLTTFGETGPSEGDLVFPGDVLGMALAPGGDMLAVVDDTGSLSLHDIGAPSPPAEVAAEIDVGKTAEVEVATSGDGSFVAAVASGGEQLQLYDVAGGVVRELDLGVPIAALSPGSGSTVYAAAEGAIVRLDAADGSVVRAVAPPAGQPAGIALVASGTSLAVWDEERLLLLDATSLDATSSYQPDGPVLDVADGATAGTLMVGIGGAAPRIALVDLGSGATLSEIDQEIASPAEIGAAGSPASFVLATARGAELGSWDATRVPWPAWWASAAVLALLAAASLVVAQRAGRAGGEPAMLEATVNSARPTAGDDEQLSTEIDFAYLERWSQDVDERPGSEAEVAVAAPPAEQFDELLEPSGAAPSAAEAIDDRGATEARLPRRPWRLHVDAPAPAAAVLPEPAPPAEVVVPPTLAELAVEEEEPRPAPAADVDETAAIPVDVVEPARPDEEPEEPTPAEAERPAAAVGPAADARYPAAVTGSIHDRMSALGFAVTAPAPAERVVDLVRTEAGSSDPTRAAVTVDGVFNGRTVSGSVLTRGVRTATFVVSLGPAPDGGTRTRFDVNWYRTSPPMVPFFPVDREESVSYGPLRDFAFRLADRLERVQ